MLQAAYLPFQGGGQRNPVRNHDRPVSGLADPEFSVFCSDGVEQIVFAGVVITEMVFAKPACLKEKWCFRGQFPGLDSPDKRFADQTVVRKENRDVRMRFPVGQQRSEAGCVGREIAVEVPAGIGGEKVAVMLELTCSSSRSVKRHRYDVGYAENILSVGDLPHFPQRAVGAVNGE